MRGEEEEVKDLSNSCKVLENQLSSAHVNQLKEFFLPLIIRLFHLVLNKFVSYLVIKNPTSLYYTQTFMHERTNELETEKSILKMILREKERTQV